MRNPVFSVFIHMMIITLVSARRIQRTYYHNWWWWWRWQTSRREGGSRAGARSHTVPSSQASDYHPKSTIPRQSPVSTYIATTLTNRLSWSYPEEYQFTIQSHIQSQCLSTNILSNTCQ